MEYFCLGLQLVFLLGIIFLPINNRYLVNYNDYYKKYFIFELIIQGLCFIVNTVLIFLRKEIMMCILAVHIILMSLILIFYSKKAKKQYFKELINIIQENNFLSVDSREMKDYLLQKYKRVYFVEDIEKCLLKINNTKGIRQKTPRCNDERQEL